MALDPSSAQTFVAMGSPQEAIPPTLLLWGDNTPDNPNASMSFDVVISEGHDATAEVTEHTVEQGTDVVDHIRPNPKTLRLEVFVSNTPITVGPDRDILPFTIELGSPGDGTFFQGGVGALIQQGAQAIGLSGTNVGNTLGFTNPPPSKVTFQVLQFEGETDYVRNAFDQLDQLLNTGTLIQIFTPKRNYSNMVIKSLAMRRDKSTGTSGWITIDFKEIRMVASKIVDAPLPSVLRATPPNDKGKLDPKAASADDQGSITRRANDTGQKIDFVPHFSSLTGGL
jgi:hypothetical protein